MSPPDRCSTAAADAYDDPHLQDRDYFQVVDQPDAGTHLLSGQIWKMANRPEVRHEPAPGLGQHNHRILGDLVGISSDQFSTIWSERQVIGTAPAARRGHGWRPTRASTGSHSPRVAPVLMRRDTPAYDTGGGAASSSSV